MWLLMRHSIRMAASTQCIWIWYLGRSYCNCSLPRIRRAKLMLALMMRPFAFADCPNRAIMRSGRCVIHCSMMPTIYFELPTKRHRSSVHLFIDWKLNGIFSWNVCLSIYLWHHNEWKPKRNPVQCGNSIRVPFHLMRGCFGNLAEFCAHKVNNLPFV